MVDKEESLWKLEECGGPGRGNSTFVNTQAHKFMQLHMNAVHYDVNYG